MNKIAFALAAAIAVFGGAASFNAVTASTGAQVADADTQRDPNYVSPLKFQLRNSGINVADADTQHDPSYVAPWKLQARDAGINVADADVQHDPSYVSPTTYLLSGKSVG